MSGNAWIFVGILTGMISLFSIPYGFYLKSKNTDQPSPHIGVSLAQSKVSGDIVGRDKIEYHIENAISNPNTGVDPVINPRMLGTTIRLTNDGAVTAIDICKTAIITALFDINRMKITEYNVIRMNQQLFDKLAPAKFVDIDLPIQLNVVAINNKNVNSIMSIYGLVVTYKREVDMKPFVIFLPFTAESLPDRDGKVGSINFAIPLFPSPGTSEAGPAGHDYSRWIELAREELLTLYRNKVAPVKVQ